MEEEPMEVTAHLNRRPMLDWVNQLTEALSGCVDRAIIDSLESIIATYQRESFTIAVMGKAKRGKSTLINALLGRTDDVVAPIDKLPASSTVSRFTYGEQESATVILRDGRSESIPFSLIRTYVTEESNPANRKDVNIVEIERPFPGLKDGLILVDTPGAGSIYEHHDQILHRFIPEADAVIFLVTARMPLDQDELDLLHEVKAADIKKIFFTINRVDECTERDLRDAIDHNLALLNTVGVSTGRMHPISAKRGFQGQHDAGGLTPLISDISSFISQNRASVLDARFIARVRKLVEPAVQALEFELVAAQRSDAELRHDREALDQKRDDIEASRGLAEREFKHAWNAALVKMERSLEVEQRRVRAELMQHIGGTQLLDVRKLAKDLPTWLNRVLEDHLLIPSQAFEEEALEACAKPQAEYPAAGVQEGAGVFLRTKTGSELITGAIGGAALTATGIGLASAASATAAGIAAANAAALSATTTVAAPSLLSAWLTALGLEALAPLATGTAAVAAPAAITTTPLWVALAGPIGWTLAGIGALAVPFSWRLSRLRLRDQLEAECLEQIDQMFLHIRRHRIPALREMGRSIVDEFHIRLDKQIAGLEQAIRKASYVAKRYRRNSRHCHRWRACGQNSAGSFGVSCGRSHEANSSGKVQSKPLNWGDLSRDVPSWQCRREDLNLHGVINPTRT
jgi:hypothetical protein